MARPDPTFLTDQFAMAGEYRLGHEPSGQSAPNPPGLTTAGSRHLEAARTRVRRGDIEAATQSAGDAVGYAPQSPDAHALLGALQLEVGALLPAVRSLQTAAALAPQWAGAWYLCGEAASQCGELETAKNHLKRALALRPDWPEAATRLGEVLIKRGEFVEGFSLFENRPGKPSLEGAAAWDGYAPLWGKSVLVMAEREIGDLLQFVRYADGLTRRGAKVIITCPADLIGTLEAVPGVHRAVAMNGPVPICDYAVPMLSLPRLFETTPATVPADVPYLLPDAAVTDAWRARFDARGKPGTYRVGLVWADPGDPTPARTRSAALADLEALWSVRGLSWFSLQQGPQAKELPYCDTPLIDVSPDLTGPDQIIGAIGALDLLIGPDTPIVHAAGAAGAPAWAMLDRGCDWRWLGVGEVTPWYPTVRLFRQEQPGAWESVARRMASALAAWVKEAAQQSA